VALRPIDPRPPERWWWWGVGEWRREGSPCFVKEGAGGKKTRWITFDPSTSHLIPQQ